MRRVLVVAFTMALMATGAAKTATLARGVSAMAAGGGHALVAGTFNVQFSFTAIQHADGSASGSFHHRTDDGLGTVEFWADVTCMAVDLDNGRAWIGGVIRANQSTSPDYTGTIFEPGHDIWFRVLDNGQGLADADRTTFVGFEGVIPSSAAYCDLKIWPDDNARTWPVLEGNISVR